jgi:hypothetical protein
LPFNLQTAQTAYTADGAGSPVIGSIEIVSPIYTTYDNGMLMLNVSVRSMADSVYIGQMVFSIDGAENVSLPLASTFVPVQVTRTYANGTTETAVSQTASYFLISGETVLPELSLGTHNLTVYAVYRCNSSISFSWPDLMDKQSVNFTINNPQATPTETEVPLENQLTAKTPNTNLLVALVAIGLIAVVVVLVVPRKHTLS